MGEREDCRSCKAHDEEGPSFILMCGLPVPCTRHALGICLESGVVTAQKSTEKGVVFRGRCVFSCHPRHPFFVSSAGLLQGRVLGTCSISYALIFCRFDVGCLLCVAGCSVPRCWNGFSFSMDKYQFFSFQGGWGLMIGRPTKLLLAALINPVQQGGGEEKEEGAADAGAVGRCGGGVATRGLHLANRLFLSRSCARSPVGTYIYIHTRIAKWFITHGNRLRPCRGFCFVLLRTASLLAFRDPPFAVCCLLSGRTFFGCGG